MTSLFLIGAAQAAWFYPGPGPEKAEVPAGAHLTGAIIAEVDDPDALLPYGTVQLLAGDGHVVRLVPEGDDVLVSRELWARPDVAWAHPDLAFELVPHEAPDDPLYEDQWHLHNTGQRGYTPGVDIDAETAWAITTGEGSLVAIIDSGVALDHPDLNIVSGWDYLGDDGDASPDLSYSGYAHGTACAGLAAGVGDNGIGVAGVALGADIHAVRFLGGSATVADLYNAFVDSVDEGAVVLSNSWGFTDDCQAFSTYAGITRAMNYAEENGRGGLGTVVVVSAGNGNCDTSEDGLLKADFVLGIAATDGYDRRESYSNFGTVVDIAGPAGGLVTTDVTGSDGYGSWDGDENYYGYMNGTSASAPVVAGVVALMVAANPRITAEQVRQVLCETAVRNDVDGAGYDSSGWSPYYGCGRVDAGAAVLAVANSEPLAPELLGPGEPTEDRVILQWAPAADADGDWLDYELSWWVGEAPEEAAEPQVVEATSLDITGLVAAGDEVGWWVQAVDSWGPGEASSGSFVVGAAPEAPAPSKPVTVDEGCSAMGEGPAWLGLVGLAGVLLRRRRPDRP